MLIFNGNWKLTVEADQAVLKLKNEGLVPVVVTGEDHHEEQDWGNLDWPSDEELSQEASKALDREVTLKFRDRGDDLSEGVYDLTTQREFPSNGGNSLLVEIGRVGQLMLNQKYPSLYWQGKGEKSSFRLDFPTGTIWLDRTQAQELGSLLLAALKTS
jgi:hypothetical protein